MATVVSVPVFMGYFGSAEFLTTYVDGSPSTITGLESTFIRAKNIGVKATQAVDTEDLVDTRYDKTVYRLGARIVEGPIDFPVCYDPTGTSVTSVNALWLAAMTRNPTTGALTQSFDLECNYAGSGTILTYQGCQINTFTFKAVESGTIDISMGVIGIDRIDGTSSGGGPKYPSRNTRVATWNDARIGLTASSSNSPDQTMTTPSTNEALSGCYIREFTITVNNNITRFYSLNHHLSPIAITATKRDISGTVRVLGRSEALARLAATNEDRCFENSRVGFGYQMPSGCGDTFQPSFTGVIYEFEEVALSPALFETTVNFKVLPGAPQSDFEVPDSTDPTPLVIPAIATTGDCINGN